MWKAGQATNARAGAHASAAASSPVCRSCTEVLQAYARTAASPAGSLQGFVASAAVYPPALAQGPGMPAVQRPQQLLLHDSQRQNVPASTTVVQGAQGVNRLLCNSKKATLRPVAIEARSAL
jgi:hypothetical protein